MKLIPPTTNLVSLLVFLGVGTRFMKPGLDVRLLVWDHLILFNITLSDKSIVVKRTDRGKRKSSSKFKIL